jgi:flagellar protein FliO/FliZ
VCAAAAWGDPVAAQSGADSENDVSDWVAQNSSTDADAARPIARRQQGALTGDSVSTASTGFGLLDCVRMVGPLAVVLGLIAALALVLRRWMAKSNRPGPVGGINVVARHYLSGKQMLCLVQLGPRLILLGTTPERISALAEITDSAEVAHLASAARRGSGFSSVLTRFSRGAAADDAAEPGDSAELIGSPSTRGGTERPLQELLSRLRAMQARPTSAEPA